MPTILKNGSFIDHRTLTFRNTTVYAEDGDNGNCSFFDHSKKNDFDVNHATLNCEGMYISKSFACGHHHVYSALARGMPASPIIPENFIEVLKNVWWTLDKCLDKEIIEASALVTAIQCAYNGITFVIDHHASPLYVDGSLEIISNAFDRIGVSHLLCYEISDRDGKEISLQGLAESKTYLSGKQGLVGLHASFTVGEAALNAAVELAEQTKSGIHIHVAEDLFDQEDCINNYGKRVINRLYDAGVLSFPKSILAHCIHLDQKERELLASSSCWVVQNTESNLNNKVGHFNAKGLSPRIMIGTDGMHSDMIRSMKSAWFAGKNFEELDFREPYRRLRNIHDYILSNNFSGDGNNNLVVLDYNPPTDFNEQNFIGHLMFGIESSHVRHVISNGKPIVIDRKIQTINEEDVIHFAKEQSLRLWGKIRETYKKNL